LKAASDHQLITPGILRRLASMCYESLLLTGILIVFLLLPQIVIAYFAHHVATASTLWIQLFLTLLIYFVWFWSHGGQTLAMKTWKIQLRTRAGHPISPAQALWRYLLCWPSLACGGIGLLWALFDREGQFLHDRIAGTRLVTS
jgi:uncharacterized RDD family membrane protein YckC